jgi:hypothetical protein
MLTSMSFLSIARVTTPTRSLETGFRKCTLGMHCPTASKYPVPDVLAGGFVDRRRALKLNNHSSGQ